MSGWLETIDGSDTSAFEPSASVMHMAVDSDESTTPQLSPMQLSQNGGDHESAGRRGGSPTRGPPIWEYRDRVRILTARRNRRAQSLVHVEIPRRRVADNAPTAAGRRRGMRARGGRAAGIGISRLDASVALVVMPQLTKSGRPGFEPGTSCSQSRRATELRHAPSGRYHNNLAPVCNPRKNGVDKQLCNYRVWHRTTPCSLEAASTQHDLQHSRLIRALVASLETAGLCPASRCRHVNIGQVFSLGSPFPSISMPERALLLGHPSQLLCPQEPL